MDFKNRLILFFILIAVIPIAALSAVFTLTVIEFKEHLSTVYSGFVTNLGILSRGKGDLLAMKSDLVQYISTQDTGTRSANIAAVKALKSDFSSISPGYKKIQDLPGGFKTPGFIVMPVSSYNIPKIASDEALLAAKINQQWKDYSSKVDDWAILSTDPSFASQANASAGQLVILTDRLVSSYDSLVELNGQIGAASKEQSQIVMQLAFFYGGIASAISAACATAAAILVSKRVVLGDLVRMSKLELVETSLRDLIGGGADALVAMVKSQMSEEEGVAPPVRAEVQSAIISSDSDDVIIGKARVSEASQETRASTKVFLDDEEEPAAPSEFTGKLVMINAGAKLSPQAAKAVEALFSNPGLVVLTRKGSNIYNRAPGRALVWVLAQDSSPQVNARTVPSADEAIIAESIQEIISGNPSSTVLVDSATELIYTLGFEKVFSLLRRVSESVSSYPRSSVVVLINKKAHEQRVIEAVGSVANEFVD